MKNQSSRWFRYWVSKGLSCILLVTVAACQQSNPGTQQSESREPTTSGSDTRLSLQNAILEQANQQGEILWKIKAERAVYSKDRETAQLEALTGNIFQNGKLVLKIGAQKGTILKNGETVFLQDRIVATDPRNGATIRGDRVEWYPQTGTLIVRQNFTGTHSKLKVSAQEGKYNTKSERLELNGDIVATALESQLQMKSDRLYWQIPQKRVIGDRPFQMTRYQNETVTDVLVADSFEVNLDTKTAIVKDNIELKSLDPLIQIATNSATWDYENRIVRANQPVRIVDSEEKMTVTGNEGQVDLVREVAHLKGGVKGENDSNKAKLYSSELVWNIPTQKVEAVGNVTYEQIEEPKFNLAGERAVGRLQDNSVVVSGRSGDRVVTEIFPQETAR